MASINLDLEIDINELIDECDDDEIRFIIKRLKENGFIKDNDIVNNQDEWGLIYEYYKKFTDLSEHAHKFTPEEESYLEKLFKKYL